MSSTDDGVQKLQAINVNIGALAQAFSTAFPTKWAIGIFTCATATATTIADPKVTANCFIEVSPANAAAGTLQGAATHLYVSARTAGSGFTVSTANGAAAAGTEQFLYHIVSN